MMIAPAWRTRLFASGGAVLAIWLGFAIAQGELFLPMICAGVVVAGLLLTLQPLALGTVMLGGAMFGYIVGNRGFAQLYLAGSLPILPAELVMLVGGTLLLVRSAFQRVLPFRRDALNLAILVWMLVATGRFVFDFSTYGLSALRDFALVYYAGFFFLAQEAGHDPAGRRFLHACLAGACATLLFVQVLYLQFPEFFFSVLTVRGNPVIYYKGDLVGTFMAVGAVLFFLRFEQRRRWWHLVLSALLVAGTFSTNNRSSMLGLGVVTLAWLFAGRWRFAAMLASGATVAVVGILLWTQISGTAWQKTPLYGFYERAVSLTDPMGVHAYSGSDTFYKGDNNLFRAVWWRNVFDETVESDPYLGLGFGHSLADRFVREYYPDAGEEFTTRSPHNVLLTLFARTGLVGLAPFLAIVALMAVRTGQAIRAGTHDSTLLWCGAWIIFISSCFGVVLEGPMGAVLFWTMLGLADGPVAGKNGAPAKELPAKHAAALQPAPQADEVAVE